MDFVVFQFKAIYRKRAYVIRPACLYCP